MPRPRIALATRAGLPPFGHDELALATQALAEEGVEAETIVWTEPHDPGAFDAIVIRSTWDYPEKVERFLEWTRSTAKATRLWNSAPLVEWNVHKSYLLDLQANGIPIPPTRLVRRDERPDLAALMRERGWSRAVVKPAVGVTSIGSMFVDEEREAQGQKHLEGLLSRGDALVQGFLPSVATHGEVSIFAFGGEVAHAVRKTPKPGDYRVQSEYGGTTVRATPTPAELGLARRVLAAAPHAPLYARIDIVALPDGSPALMELEAIEPYLYFGGIDQVRPYARAIRRALDA